MFIFIAAPVNAGDWTGGIPLVTVQSGNVTGDLWMDIDPAPNWGDLEINKDFTLPATAVGNITWARLYISAYCGHMQNDYAFTITSRWDGNGDRLFDGPYDRVWPETGHAPFHFVINADTFQPEGNDNSAFPGHGTGEQYKMINDHENRVTSDYFMYYDVTDLIKNQTVRLNVNTHGSFDGRIKVTSLLVAYNDPDSITLTHYWVNEGHDALSYYTENNFGYADIGETTFATNDVGPVTFSKLTINYMASNNGYYGFPTSTNDFTVTGSMPPVEGNFTRFELDRDPDKQGAYSGVDSWDVTSVMQGAVALKRPVTLAYSRYFPASGTAAFYKLPLAMLVTKGPLAPVADFTADSTAGMAPLTVQFTDRSKGGNPSYWYWDFDNDGTIDNTTQNPVYTFGSPGTYTVRLTVSNDGGAHETVKAGFVTVMSAAGLPIPRFNAIPLSGSAPLTVQFTDASLNSPTGWNWSFGDGNFSALQNPSHEYAFAGSFTVSLNATNAEGSGSTVKPGYVTVNAASAAPVAAFSGTPLSGAAPLTVLFTDTSSNSPTSRIWDFGDGNSTWSTMETTFAHTYSSTGSYTVKLTAGNFHGSDDEEKIGYITVSTSGGSTSLSLAPRIQSFNAGETREYQVVLDNLPRGIAGFDMYITLTNASVADITGVKYPSWAQLSKTPLLPNRTVRLNAVDTNQQVWPGAADVVLATITVRGLSDGMTAIGMAVGELSADGGGLPLTLTSVNNGTAIIGSYAGPVASFSANVTTGPANLTVQFTDQSLGSPTGWAWDFNNDGTLDSVLQNPLATFTTPAKYTVVLTVNNDVGSDTLMMPDYITVTAPGTPASVPIAAFSGTPLSGTIPLTVLFTDTSTNSPTSRVWDFGDGNSTWSTTAMTFAHTYTAAGSYTVKLTVANGQGSDDETKTGYITATVPAGPAAAFSANPTSGTVPLTVQFTDKSTGDPWYWSWNFGDGSASVSQNPTHTYTSAGIYTASLRVSADGSAWSTAATKTITVNTASGAPGAGFTVSVSSGTVPLTVIFTDTSSGTPTSWAWDFDNDGTTDSTDQNPSHEYTTKGTYTAKLTATNSVGSGTAMRTITVTSSATPSDLTVENIVPNLCSGGASANVFAYEENPVTLRIKNGGTGSSTATTVQLVSSDGFTGTATVPIIAAGAETTVVVTDTRSRSSESSISYTATVDPGNMVEESSESNNAKTTSFNVKYNGYKGSRYWSGKSDITTKHTFDLHGGLVYSSGDSEYRSGGRGGGWLSYTVNWKSTDLPIPDDATVKAAYLYIPYTWDNQEIAPNHVDIDFNGNSVPYSAAYTDTSNFGAYADHAYGLIVYDVKKYFNKNEANSAVFTRHNPYVPADREASATKLSPNEFYLVVVYEDASASRQQIFINEGYDLLGASKSYGTVPAETISYIPFTGMTIDTAAMDKATLITFVPFGDTNEGNLLYNGNLIASNVWSWGGSGTAADGGQQVARDTRDVTSKIQSTGNTFAIQSTFYPGNESFTTCMGAAHQFLIIDYGEGTSQSSYSSGSTTTTGTSTKETTSVLSSTSGVATMAKSRTQAPSAASGTVNSIPAAATSVHNLLAPSTPSSGDILDNPPSGSTRETGSDLTSWIFPGALVGGIAVLGATSVYAYRSGWIPYGAAGNGNSGTQVLCHDGSGTCPTLLLNIGSGIISAVQPGTGTSTLHLPRMPPFLSRALPAIVVVIAVTGIVIAATFFGLPGFGLFGAASSSTPGSPFDILLTVESIRDLDTANHAPDYPVGFSARNGILVVYKGTEKFAIPDLELRLSKGVSEVAITAKSHPPVENAVNPELTSYFEEMGNGDGTLSPGEWLMVYADNCYDSSTSDSNPRGQVLVWQPDFAPRVEVPVKDTIEYRLTDKRSGTVLRQGTLQFIPP